MKKNVSVIIAMLLLGATAFGQAVKDRNVIPVSVNLNQVLRMNVINGGNIEFVFNNIDEYKLGLSGNAGAVGANDGATDVIYQTDFTIASSTNWQLFYGAERDALYGVDDPANHSMDLDNIGVNVLSTGLNAYGATGIASPLTTDGTLVADLDQYDGTVTLLELGADAAASNAGDALDNAFTILWSCGTMEGDMNAVPLITQSLAADRYTVNVLFDLAIQ